MTDVPRIGIVGGYGAAGRKTARQLAGSFRIRVGGRDAAAGTAFVRGLGDGADWRGVDVAETDSLASFCKDCRVIVNLAQSSSLMRERVAGAAFAAGADYVDAGGDVDWKLPAGERTAVLGAGMYPGLSGLLPRIFAADEVFAVTGLTAFIGGCDRLSAVAARDYLQSLTDGSGKLNVAWSGGRLVAHKLSADERRSLPFFARPVYLRPYLTAEAERLGDFLQLSDLRFYSAFDGEHVAAALPAAVSRNDAESLVRAAELDLFGNEPYQIMLFELAGTIAAAPAWRSLLIKARSGSDLTGITAAAAAVAAVDGRIPAGAHYFPEVMDARAMIDELQHADGVCAVDISDRPLTCIEQGEI